MPTDPDRRAEFDAKLTELFDFIPADHGPDDDDIDDDIDDGVDGVDDDSNELDDDDFDDDDFDDDDLVEGENEDDRDTARHRPPTAPTARVTRALTALTQTDFEGDRLQKVLARAGVGSRRACEELIEAGKVRVNDEVAVLGRRVDPETDLITVNGAPIPTRAGLVHYLLNKPSGVVTTADDELGRETVLDLVPEEPRVFPVGRLDIETEGLLIITNDGELAYRLTHPSFGVEKEYLAKVRGRPTEGLLHQLRAGVELEDGPTSPAKATLMGPDLIRITIHEGRNRQVRRMLDAVGHPAVRLVRTRIGPIADRSLPPGRWRPLSVDEVHSLGRTVRTTRTMRRAEIFGEPTPEPSTTPTPEQTPENEGR